MNFIPTPLAGAFLIEPEFKEDERGFFARTWCQREFTEHGLTSRLVQCSISYNRRKGTLRGMHFQTAPMAEDKLVRVTQGRAYDVIVDLRAGSDTFLAWFGVELTQSNRRALFVPQGFAHGFETLVDDTEVYYQMSEFYSPLHAHGFRWNDSSVGVVWPEPITAMSDRDRSYPDLKPELLAGVTGG
jgi:dTDP-4-dehydrorhamnose 3,5-epimerase